MIRLPRLGAIGAVVALLAASSPSSAQGSPSAEPATVEARERAASLKRQGDAALDSRRFADALAAYDESYALVPDPALLYNRGRALQFLARIPEAFEAIESFAAQAPPPLLARVPGLGALRKELRAQVTTVTLRSAVSGARVLVNDRQIGMTPFPKPITLASGRMVVDAFADGYFPLHRVVDAPGGGAVTVDLSFASRETSGFLSVRSRQPETQVTIDGVASGVAPIEAGLPEGAHRVVVRKPGFDDATTRVVLRAGETKELWLDPVGRPPVYARWWFWTAVGAAVVAGVVTVVVLETEKSPRSGDFSPGLVRF